jgi:hypothetical protein
MGADAYASRGLVSFFAFDDLEPVQACAGRVVGHVDVRKKSQLAAGVPSVLSC